VQVAETIAKQALKDTGLQGNWVIANGDGGNTVAQQIELGYHNVIDPYIKSGTMKLISDAYNANWDPNNARAQIENALTKTNNNITGVLGAADETNVGILAALVERNLAGKVWIASQNGIEPICRAVLLGQYTYTYFSQYDLGAKIAADLAIQLADGKTITSPDTFDTGHGTVPFFSVPVFSITKDTLVSYLKVYSPGYVSAKNIFAGVPQSQWPAGAAELLAAQGG
jgi:D-xylose transport system substrate-binding protein